MTVNLIISLVSGLITGLSFDFANLSFLTWFSLVPFFYVIGKSTTRQSLLYGFVFGIFLYGSSIFWVSRVTRLGAVALITYLSLYPALFALLAKSLLRRPLRIFTCAFLWVILEFLKEHLFSGFGWANLGYSQYSNLYLIQIADLGGVKLISFLIIMFNVLLWEFVLCRLKRLTDSKIKRFLLIKAAGACLVIFCCIFYSFYRLNSLRETSSLSISLIQPNIPQRLKWDPRSLNYILNKLETLAKETKRDSLVIFPESSWPSIVNEGNLSSLKEFARTIDRNILIGALKHEEYSVYNTALLFDSKGNLSGTYRKIKLVPFGEYVPLRSYLGFIDIINVMGDIGRGKIFKTFSYADKNFGVLICFEDIFPLFVSRFSKENDLLINITNDAWFGGWPQAGQHLGIMVFRAIENRISVIRCANTGVSGWVSFRGDIEKLAKGKKDVFFTGTKSFSVALNSKRSFYSKTKDTVFLTFCSIFLGGSLLLNRTNYA